MNNECAVLKIDNWRDPLPEEEEEVKKEDSKHTHNSSINKSKTHS